MPAPGKGSRFDDGERYASEFLAEVWVRCPRCDAPGVVVSPAPYLRSRPTFTCASCTLQLAGRGSAWYGPSRGVAQRRCRQCGRPLRRELRSARGYGEARVILDCPGCGAGTETDVGWRPRPDGSPVDPAFGLPLRLQCPCAGRTLWALNPAHASFLRDFAAAGLRTRVPNRQRSLVSRLPAWIKAAKNRDAVTRALDRMLESVRSA